MLSVVNGNTARAWLGTSSPPLSSAPASLSSPSSSASARSTDQRLKRRGMILPMEHRNAVGRSDASFKQHRSSERASERASTGGTHRFLHYIPKTVPNPTPTLQIGAPGRRMPPGILMDLWNFMDCCSCSDGHYIQQLPRLRPLG